MQSWCPGCMDPISKSDTLLVRHENEIIYVFHLSILADLVGTAKDLLRLEAFFLTDRTTDTT